MTIMYQLPVYMPNDVKVEPIPVMYSLPSYHANVSDEKSQASQSVEIIDPIALIEKKQVELIRQLNAFSSKLDIFLKDKASAKTSEKPQKQEKASAPEAASSKKDKDAKKEARKAAKNEAKNKVNATGGAQKKGGADNAGRKTWVVKEEKPSTESGQSLTPCTKQALSKFKQENVGEVKIIASASDLTWLNAVAKIAKNVAFTGAVSNSVKKAQTNVNVTKGDKFSLTAGSLSISRRVPAWKLLGSALGIFSFASEQAFNATHQHLWLEKANQVLLGKLPVDELMRAASQFLSSFDSLGAQYNFGIADLIVKSLLPSSDYPNNVELWANRINEL